MRGESALRVPEQACGYLDLHARTHDMQARVKSKTMAALKEYDRIGGLPDPRQKGCRPCYSRQCVFLGMNLCQG